MSMSKYASKADYEAQRADKGRFAILLALAMLTGCQPVQIEDGMRFDVGDTGNA